MVEEAPTLGVVISEGVVEVVAVAVEVEIATAEVVVAATRGKLINLASVCKAVFVSPSEAT